MTQQELVESCIPLVSWIAKRLYPKKNNDSTIRAAGTFEDLVAEGHLALCRAARGFDPARLSPKTGKPVRFATYAHRAVQTAMREFIATRRGVIRLPRWNLGTYAEHKAHYAAHPFIRVELEALELYAPRTDPDPEGCMDLHAALAYLPCRDRHLLEQYYAKGMLLRELGERWGVTREAMRNRIAKVVGKLRKHLRAV